LSILTRIATSLLIALAISLAARRVRALNASGAMAATAVGTLALLAGWRWGVLLLLYFASSSALSHLGAATKERRTAGVIEKGGARDALQVLANGGVFAIAAALAAVFPHDARWLALGAGALAASASDTWATEIGTLVGGAPRSILGFGPLPVGMSGGITIAGTLAAFAGALFVAAATALLSWPTRVAIAAALGGIAGSTLDSLVGASLQGRRWCDTCDCASERDIHDCGSPTRRAGGVAWVNNDAVNLACGLMGGLVALGITG
jgi:uncharacterized protein (TIGR00297 family)